MTDLVQTVYGVISGIIGSSVGNRVHFALMPSDAVYPCVIYSPIYGGDGEQASGGKGTYRGRYQIDLYHDTVSGVLALRHTMLLGLKQYSGGLIIRSRIDLDVPYYVDEIDKWRHIIDFSVETEWES